ncbi:hypothetical protein [Noviherbaspirillum massiliense]|uniref:hypothetical protein n=1 Tax=Noviherbaspirillum massiliense TaxID=1465823 RepID=UPI001C54E870|nr:hypothetical protein [Noviherbaspirillum massiliense]
MEKIDKPASQQPEPRQGASSSQEQGQGQDQSVGIMHALKEIKDAFVEGAARAKEPRAHVADYIGLLQESERRLVQAFDQVRNTHPDEPDIGPLCAIFAQWSSEAAKSLDPFVNRYGERKEGEPERLDKLLMTQRSQGGFDMLRDLHDLWLLVNESMISLDILEQAARSMHDKEFEAAIKSIRHQNKRQRAWLRTRLRQAAPQTLVVPS